MIEVIGFETCAGLPCAVYLMTQYTSGKRKPYRAMDRAIRCGGWWLPHGRVPSERWFVDVEPCIERQYDIARACGLDGFVP